MDGDIKERINVLWFPQLRYLSLQPYAAIINEAKHKGQNILLDTSAYSGRFQAITETEKSTLLETYDNVYVLSPCKSKYHVQRNLDEYAKYKELKRKILEIVHKENIGLAVFPTDFIYEFRVLRRCLPEVKLIVLQVSFRQSLPYREYNFRHKIKAFCYDNFLGVPIFRANPNFGHQHSTAWYFFWSEKWAKSIVNNMDSNLFFANATLQNTNYQPPISLPIQIAERKGNKPLVTIFLNKRLSIGLDAIINYTRIYQYLIQKSENYFFVLKVHPQEELKFFKSLYEGSKINNYLIVKDEYRPEELLLNSDLFITQWSTSIADCMKARIPTLLLNPHKTHDMESRMVADFPFIAYDEESIVSLMNSILMQEESYWYTVEEFIKNSFGNSFNKGPQRFAEALRKVQAGEITKGKLGK